MRTLMPVVASVLLWWPALEAQPARHYFYHDQKIELTELPLESAAVYLIQDTSPIAARVTAVFASRMSMVEGVGVKQETLAAAFSKSGWEKFQAAVREHLKYQQVVPLRCFRVGASKAVLVEAPEVIVQFKAGVAREAAEKFLMSNYAVTLTDTGVANQFLVRLQTANQTLDLANALHWRKDLVEFAEPNFQIMRPSGGSPPVRPVWPPAQQGGSGAGATGDPGFPLQWALWNRGDLPLAGVKKGADIRVLPVWKQLSAQAPEVRVAVMDFAVDVNHPDLRANIDPAQFFNAVDPGLGRLDVQLEPAAEADHGTGCAGVIGAVHNTLGVAGAMPRVKLLPIEIAKFSSDGSVTAVSSDILSRAMRAAVALRADVISFSWGQEGQIAIEFSNVIEQALKGLQAGRGNKGILFVVAAGNDQEGTLRGIDYPARLSGGMDWVLPVGASDWCDGIKEMAGCDNEAWWRSKRPSGGNPLLIAPGVGILTTSNTRAPAVPGSPLNYRANFSGTSAATPLVAAVAALMVQQDGSRTAAEIKKLLWDNADRLGASPYRRLNACKALGLSACDPQ